MLVVTGMRQCRAERRIGHRCAGHRQRAVYRHGKAVGTDAGAVLHMVDNVRHHGHDEVAGRRRAEAFQRHAHRHRDQPALPQPGDHTAHSTRQKADAADPAFAVFVGKGQQQRRSRRHGQRAHHGQQRLRRAPRSGAAQHGVVHHPLAVVGHGAVFQRAAPLEQQVENHDDPPHAVGSHRFHLLHQCHFRYLCRRRLRRLLFFLCGLKLVLRAEQPRHDLPLLRDPLTGVGKLKIDGCPGKDRDPQHGEEPPVQIILQRKGHQHGEHHTADTHHAQTHHAVDGRKQPSLAAVAGGHRDHDSAGRAVDGRRKGVVEIVGNRDPRHARRAAERHNEHEHAGCRKRER